MTRDEAERKLREAGRPFVTLKFAQSLDGRIATRTGDSKWISGEDSRRFAHRLRSEHDVIMVGIGTVLADDPQLTVRMADGRDPLRVIVDSRLRTPPSARVLSGAAKHALIACTEEVDPLRVKETERLGAEVVKLPSAAAGKSAGVDLAALLKLLGQRGIASVLAEGGSRIVTSLLEERLADRLVIVVAPIIIGRGVEAIGDLGITEIRDAIRFSKVETLVFGDDVVIDALL